MSEQLALQQCGRNGGVVNLDERLFASLAQFERDLIRERTKAGQVAGRLRGKHPGRRVVTTDDKRIQAKRLLAAGESPEAALARELQEELGVTLVRSVEIGRVHHHYAGTPEELEIRFFAAAITESDLVPYEFEKIAWVLPRELGEYDFLAANRELIAQLATGRIKPAEILEGARETGSIQGPAAD